MGPSLLSILFLGLPGGVLHAWPGRGGVWGLQAQQCRRRPSEEVACLWERRGREACGVWVLLGGELGGLELRDQGGCRVGSRRGAERK